jgi:hypothetical protein
VRSGTNWTQQAYLKASNTGAEDNFGLRLAMSGDTLAVSAPFEDSSATGISGNQGNNNAVDSGAAYIFVRAGTNWSQQAYLKASNTGADDTFGSSLGVSGDTVVVGAFQEDSNSIGVNGNQNNNSAGESGVAYVFTGVGVPRGPTITGYTRLASGAIQLQFNAASAAAGYAVLASTNLIDWLPLGLASETVPGHFEFMDADARNHATRFYQLKQD